MPARFLVRDGDVRVSFVRYNKSRLFIYIGTIFSVFGQFGEISRICRIVAKRGSRITSSNGSTAEIFVASAGFGRTVTGEDWRGCTIFESLRRIVVEFRGEQREDIRTREYRDISRSLRFEKSSHFSRHSSKILARSAKGIVV